MDSKYIVFKGGDDEYNVFMIIFPSWKTHSQIAIYMTGNINWLKVDSAGFIHFGDNNMCYGTSDSLNIAAKPERDNMLLKHMLNN